MEWVERAPAATAPTVWALRGDISINAYTASIKVMSQEQTDRLRCTGLSRNEQISWSKKSFSWHLVCGSFYAYFWEGIQNNSVHHGSEGIWVYPVLTPLSTNKHTVWCTGDIFGHEINRIWFYNTLIFLMEMEFFCTIYSDYGFPCPYASQSFHTTPFLSMIRKWTGI